MSNTIQILIFTIVFVALGGLVFVIQNQNVAPFVSPAINETLVSDDTATTSSPDSTPNTATTTEGKQPSQVVRSEESSGVSTASPELIAMQTKVQEAITSSQLDYNKECPVTPTSTECISYKTFITELQHCLDTKSSAVTLELCANAANEKLASLFFKHYEEGLVQQQKEFLADLDATQQGHLTATNPTNEMLSALPAGETKKTFSWSEESEQGKMQSYSATVTYIRSGNSVQLSDAVTSPYGVSTFKRTLTIQ